MFALIVSKKRIVILWMQTLTKDLSGWINYLSLGGLLFSYKLQQIILSTFKDNFEYNYDFH